MASSVSGLRTAMARVASLPARAREARQEVLEDWAENTQDAAKRRVPERTGRLEASIDKRVYSDAAYVGVYNSDALEYAEYVEKGTSSMREQPYLMPAFRRNGRNEVARQLRAAIQRRFGGA